MVVVGYSSKHTHSQYSVVVVVVVPIQVTWIVVVDVVVVNVVVVVVVWQNCCPTPGGMLHIPQANGHRPESGPGKISKVEHQSGKYAISSAQLEKELEDVVNGELEVIVSMQRRGALPTAHKPGEPQIEPHAEHHKPNVNGGSMPASGCTTA
jgi:hypothetical protein